jgi:hypothetical protein
VHSRVSPRPWQCLILIVVLAVVRPAHGLACRLPERGDLTPQILLARVSLGGFSEGLEQLMS